MPPRLRLAALLVLSAVAISLPGSARGQCDSPRKEGSNVDLGVVTAPCNNSNCLQQDLAWNGDGYGLVRRVSGEIVFNRLAADGSILDTATLASTSGVIYSQPALAWNGSGYGVVFTRSCGYQCWVVDFQRIDASGSLLGSRVTVSGGEGGAARIVWNGSGYGLAWTSTTVASVRFARLDASGTKLGGETLVGWGLSSGLTWTGSEYGLGWCHTATGSVYDCSFSRLSSTGSLLGTVQLTTTDTDTGDGRTWVSVAWSGSEYGVAWKGHDPVSDLIEQIYFQRVTSMGSLIGTTTMITPSYSGDSIHPEAVWHGAGYGVAYQDYSSGNYEIWLASLGPDGTKLASRRLSLTSTDSEVVSLAWTGSEYGLAWQENLSSSLSHTYFARARCCNDADADGVSACAGDCDDANPDVYPLAPQICDGLNNDCNHASWPGLAGTNEADADGDGFSTCSGDCNDTLASVFPGNIEVCDGLDNNCSGVADEGLDTDADGDGWNAPGSCLGPFDCDDGNPARWECNTPVSNDPVTMTEPGVTITFPNITSGGDTTITVGDCDFQRVDGLAYTSPSTFCVDVQTDAAWSGLVEVCFDYDDTGMSLAQEQALKMVRCDGASPPVCDLLPLAPPPPGGTNPDTDLNRICALTEGFSYLAIGEPLDTDSDGTPDLIDNCPAHYNLFQLDGDVDGWGDACDCDAANPAAWSAPGPVANLRLSHQPSAGLTTLAWEPPLWPGGTWHAYDTLRATAGDAFATAVCVETDDGADATALDDTPPPDVGAVFYYLIRAEADCATGQGTLGAGSSGEERSGRSCP